MSSENMNLTGEGEVEIQKIEMESVDIEHQHQQKQNDDEKNDEEVNLLIKNNNGSDNDEDAVFVYYKKLMEEHEKKYHSKKNKKSKKPKKIEPIITIKPEKLEVTNRELANPGPLGLACFGITTILLNIHNAGLYKFDVMIIATGLFYGGICQVIAGVLEYTRNNTFGMVAFCSYGTFWITLIFIKMAPDLITTYSQNNPATKLSMGFFLTAWGLFTLGMTACTFSMKGPHLLQVVFILLFILFCLLALGDFINSPSVTIAAGIEGIVCGLVALYLSMAEMLYIQWGYQLLPFSTNLVDLKQKLKELKERASVIQKETMKKLFKKKKKSENEDSDSDSEYEE